MFINLANIKINNKLFFIISTILICIIYSLIYWSLGNTEHFNIQNSIQNNLTYIDALYFSFTTHITLGYGDITAKSQFMRSIVISHVILIILSLTYANLV